MMMCSGKLKEDIVCWMCKETNSKQYRSCVEETNKRKEEFELSRKRISSICRNAMWFEGVGFFECSMGCEGHDHVECTPLVYPCTFELDPKKVKEA